MRIVKKAKPGDNLTLTAGKKLQYNGGPGDINSTDGMKPNKKQRAMLPKKNRIGGMINGAKKIKIYDFPDDWDHIFI